MADFGLGLLEQSPHWTAEDKQGMQAWSGQFLDWMETSEKGMTESIQIANHSTNFDMLAALLSLYTGDEDKAEDYVKHYARQRIRRQFDGEGKQILEIVRADDRF